MSKIELFTVLYYFIVDKNYLMLRCYNFQCKFFFIIFTINLLKIEIYHMYIYILKLIKLLF